MLALGLALLIVGGGLTLIFIVGGSNDAAVIDIIGLHADTNSMVIFFVGLIAGIVLLAGLSLIRRGLARDFRRRRETKKLRERAETAERHMKQTQEKDDRGDKNVMEDHPSDNG